MTGDALNLAIGSLEIVLAVVVARHVWRFRRGFPWLIALTAFFLLRGVDRVVVPVVGQEPAVLDVLVDVLVLLILVLLVFAIKRLVHGLEFALDAAKFREREYRRALLDYRRLARHRIANPLTAIIGSVRALKELDVSDEKLRGELLATILGEAERLESISLDPDEALRPEERGLRPKPRLEANDGRE
jgi:signal transduction histidine kinase